MRLRMMCFAALLLLAAACSGQTQTIYVVVTATPPEGVATAEVAAVDTATPVASPGSVPAAATAAATATPTAPGTSVPPTADATPLPAGFPTPVVAQIRYAEQLFEHGRMFWLEPIGQIWVLLITGEGRGTWSTYEDTWLDGEPELDPALTAPAANLQQPVRGFGKLWRTNTPVQQALGWAVQPEYGYVADYEYHAGGAMNAQGQYVRAPGYHIIYSLYGERFRLNEADSTWTLGGG